MLATFKILGQLSAYQPIRSIPGLKFKMRSVKLDVRDEICAAKQGFSIQPYQIKCFFFLMAPQTNDKLTFVTTRDSGR